MIEIQAEQRSKEWRDARLGVPTASQFHRLTTAKTGKPSKQADKYLAELVAEHLIQEPLDFPTSDFMERGIVLEAEARAWYEFQTGREIRDAGFCLLDDRSAGASPDGFVDPDGLTEIKCHSAAIHVASLLGDPADDHRPQVQGQLLVTGKAWCDYVLYNPVIESRIIRIERDEDYIAALLGILQEFTGRVAEALERLKPDESVPVCPISGERLVG